MRKNKKKYSEEDKLFSSAIFLLAEEEGEEALKSFENNKAKDMRNESNNSFAESTSFKKEWKCYNHLTLKRKILPVIGSAACIAVLLAYGVLSGWIDMPRKDSDVFQEQILNNMFVYADSQEYPFGSGNQIVLPDSKLKWGKGEVGIEGSIIGIDNPDIVRLTYRVANGRLFSSLKTAIKDDRQEVSFYYYDDYWKYLMWLGNPDDVFNITEMDDPDFSLLEPDILTVDVAMKDSVKYQIEISIGYTSDGNVQAEIKNWKKIE